MVGIDAPFYARLDYYDYSLEDSRLALFTHGKESVNRLGYPPPWKFQRHVFQATSGPINCELHLRFFPFYRGMLRL